MYNELDLLEVLKKRPFTPLSLEVVTGELLPITHPEQAMITSTDGVILTTPSTEKPGTVDWRLIGLDHIVGIRMSQAESN